jgi:hypothetical protein
VTYKVQGEAAWTGAIAAATAAMLHSPPSLADADTAPELLALALVFARREATDHGWTDAWRDAHEGVARAVPGAPGLQRVDALLAVEQRDWARARVLVDPILERWGEDRVGIKVAYRLASHDPAPLSDRARRALDVPFGPDLVLKAAAVRAGAGEPDRCVELLDVPFLPSGISGERALLDACRAVAVDSPDPAEVLALARLLRALDRPDAARALIDGLASPPPAVAAQLPTLRARLALERWDLDGAVAVARSAPLPPWLVLEIAGILESQGRPQVALALLEPPLAAPPPALPAELAAGWSAGAEEDRAPGAPRLESGPERDAMRVHLWLSTGQGEQAVAWARRGGPFPTAVSRVAWAWALDHPDDPNAAPLWKLVSPAGSPSPQAQFEMMMQHAR